MSTTPPAAPHAAPAELTVADFLDGQLQMFARRTTGEKRAKIRWWQARLKLLAEQEPGDVPIPAEPKAA